MHDRQVREVLSEQGRAERQVVILEPDKGAFPTTLFRHDSREVRIDLLVVAPIGQFEHGVLEVEVTEGPQDAVRKAIVKPLHLSLAQPHAPQRVLGVVRRHRHMIVGVDRLPVSAATPPGHPGAVAGLHDRIERCGEATSRLTPVEGVVALKYAGDLDG